MDSGIVYPLNSDHLSSGYRYPPFEQLGPDIERNRTTQAKEDKGPSSVLSTNGQNSRRLKQL